MIDGNIWMAESGPYNKASLTTKPNYLYHEQSLIGSSRSSKAFSGRIDNQKTLVENGGQEINVLRYRSAM